jgi:hypothetical protein
MENNTTIPFYNRFSFAFLQTSASGTNAFCLQPSLQLQMVLQSGCKENMPRYQLFMKMSFATLFAAILN